MRRALLILAISSAVGCGNDATTAGSAGGGGSSSTQNSTGTGGQAGLVCDATGISKGPWALHVDETSARVRWEACAPGSEGAIRITPEEGGDEQIVDSVESEFELTKTAYPLGDAPPDWAGTYFMHQASLSGLNPGTCYNYALVADAERKGRLCTAKPSGEPFTFMAIGDTNPGLGVTDDILASALPMNPDFTIHGGDIQYYSSFLETWASWFPIMQPMLSQGAFFPAIGNHEIENDEELSEYALRFFGEAGFDGGETYHQVHSGGVWFFTVNTEEPISQGSPQAIWLQQGLEAASKRSDYRFSVVYFHRPLLTCGDVADDPAAFDFLGPVFEDTNVLFVLQAHMHGYERFELGSGPTYLTSGGGGGVLSDVDLAIDREYCDSRVASGAFYHAIVFEVDSAEVRGTVIDHEGTVQDTFSRGLAPLP